MCPALTPNTTNRDEFPVGPGIWPPPRAGKRVYLFHPFDSTLGKGNRGCCNLYRLNRNNYWRTRIFGGGFYTRLFQVQVILALPIVRVVSNLNLSLRYFYTIFVFGSLSRYDLRLLSLRRTRNVCLSSQLTFLIMAWWTRKLAPLPTRYSKPLLLQTVVPVRSGVCKYASEGRDARAALINMAWTLRDGIARDLKMLHDRLGIQLRLLKIR